MKTHGWIWFNDEGAILDLVGTLDKKALESLLSRSCELACAMARGRGARQVGLLEERDAADYFPDGTEAADYVLFRMAMPAQLTAKQVVTWPETVTLERRKILNEILRCAVKVWMDDGAEVPLPTRARFVLTQIVEVP